MIISYKGNTPINLANCNLFVKQYRTNSFIFYKGRITHFITFYFNTYKVSWEFDSQQERDEYFDELLKKQ